MCVVPFLHLGIRHLPRLLDDMRCSTKHREDGNHGKKANRSYKENSMGCHKQDDAQEQESKWNSDSQTEPVLKFLHCKRNILDCWVNLVCSEMAYLTQQCLHQCR